MQTTLNIPLKERKDLALINFWDLVKILRHSSVLPHSAINTFIFQINISEMTVFRPTLGRAYFAFKYYDTVTEYYSI